MLYIKSKSGSITEMFELIRLKKNLYLLVSLDQRPIISGWKDSGVPLGSASTCSSGG